MFYICHYKLLHRYVFTVYIFYLSPYLNHKKKPCDVLRSKLNKRERIPKWQSKMDNPEKLANRVHKTKKKKTKYKHNTICVGHNYTQTNTNDVNKT